MNKIYIENKIVGPRSNKMETKIQNDGKNDHCMDTQHVQSMDGLRESLTGLQELLRGDAYKKQDGPIPMGSGQRPAENK